MSEERGQVLLLFVVVFSVILAMGALSLDQGFWLGRHRAIQAAADASARAGALVRLGDLSGGNTCSNDSPRREAALTAIQNRFNANWPTCSGPHADTAFTSASSCPGGGADRSVTASIGQEQPSFFAGGFGIDDINASAESTACVGTARKIAPVFGNNPVEYLPVYVQTDDNSGNPASRRPPNSCFDSSGAPRFGQTCVIMKARSDPPGGPPPPFPHRTGLFREPGNDDECRASNSNSFDTDWIEDGIDYTCTVHTSGGCNDDLCIRATSYPSSASQTDDMLDAFFDRWNGDSGSCNSFDETFGRVDGGSVGSPSSSEVYYQRCSSGRAGLVTLVGPGGGSERQVKGFAMAYILGCFDQRNGQQDSNCDNNEEEHLEVRAVLIRVFLPHEDRGDLGSVSSSGGNPNGVYAIHTVE